ncbi:sialoadhesin-like [Sardina pilchardus]|uniref:sialoadhesin-like n=1 Tax=Sardina pilchardus TaxID=27697 RepID=UPI002E15CF99
MELYIGLLLVLILCSFSGHAAETPNTVLVLEPDQTQFYTGESVTLKCNIGEQDTSGWWYNWHREEQKVYPPGTWTESNEYTIQALQVFHSGNYTCTALYNRVDFKSGTKALNISERPKAVVSLSPSWTPVFSGESITLTCSIQGESSSDWRYRWYRGDQQVHPQRGWSYSDEYRLQSVQENDSGVYSCQGQRKKDEKVSHMSDGVTLNVSTPPAATLTVTPQSPVFTGDIFLAPQLPEIYCFFKSFFFTVWFKDTSYKIVSTGRTFTLNKVSESHHGRYWCQGERSERPTSSHKSSKTTIEVKASKPKLTLSPGHQLLTGDSVTLRCELGASAGLMFHWYRDTQTSDPVAQTDGDSYSISSVKVSDGGQYWCRAGRGDPVHYTQYSDAAEIKVTERPKATITLKSNWTEFFRGEEVSLRCDIKSGESSDWEYSWFRDEVMVYNRFPYHTDLKPVQSGHYICKGKRKHDRKLSEKSDAVGITIYSEKARAVLSSLSQTWLTEGDSVTLSCEVRGSSTGWRFHWYKTAPYRSELTHITHENRRYYIELISDSIRGAGGSYTLSPSALRDTGVYVCRAERGEPAHHTEFSQPQPLWVTGVSPPAYVIIRSNWTQIFKYEHLFLSCGVESNSAGWRLRWFTGRGGQSKCPTDWRSERGSSCSISSASPSDSGVYWCQSESGEQSPVNITVHNGDAILESPVHPVTEGDPLTLRCRYRSKPSNISADFYKDGTLLQTSTTGEMTIPAVSKSHEGLYKCRYPERRGSPESWITVRDAGSSGSSKMVVAVGVVIGLLVAFALVILLALLYRSQKAKGSVSVTPNHGPMQSNSHSSTSQKRVLGGAVAGTGDVVYAEIELKNSDKEKKEVRRRATMSDTLYSLLRPVKSPVVSDGGGDGSSDMTYANVKSKKHKKQDPAGPSDVTYADVQIKMKPLGSRAKPAKQSEKHLYSAVKTGCSSTHQLLSVSLEDLPSTSRTATASTVRW